MSFEIWFSFTLLVFLLVLTPGPSILIGMSHALRYGARPTLMTALGDVTANMIQMVIAAVGLGAVLATSVTAFAIVKWIGVAYLVWLGLGALRSSFAKSANDAGSGEPAVPVSTKPMTAFAAWRQGVMIDVLNPKVAIFFMAFLPQFVDPAMGNGATQFLVLGLVVLLIALVVEGMLVMAVASAAGRIKGSRRLGAWLHRALGTMFIALGIRLAVTQQ